MKVQALKVDSNKKEFDTETTYLVFVLDESPSMSAHYKQTISGFNEFLEAQKKAPGKCIASVITFSTGEVRFRAQNTDINTIKDLQSLGYKPSGMGTALYDAMGDSIQIMEQYLASLDKIPNILLVAMTDGEENASRKFTAENIKAKLATKQTEGWTVTYLGANQDAWSVGSQFGLSKGQTMSYDTLNMVGTMKSFSDSAVAYRSAKLSGALAAGAVSANFFDKGEDKDDASK